MIPGKIRKASSIQTTGKARQNNSTRSIGKLLPVGRWAGRQNQSCISSSSAAFSGSSKSHRAAPGAVLPPANPPAPDTGSNSGRYRPVPLPDQQRYARQSSADRRNHCRRESALQQLRTPHWQLREPCGRWARNTNVNAHTENSAMPPQVLLPADRDFHWY